MLIPITKFGKKKIIIILRFTTLRNNNHVILNRCLFCDMSLYHELPFISKWMNYNRQVTTCSDILEPATACVLSLAELTRQVRIYLQRYTGDQDNDRVIQIRCGFVRSFRTGVAVLRSSSLGTYQLMGRVTAHVHWHQAEGVSFVSVVRLGPTVVLT